MGKNNSCNLQPVTYNLLSWLFDQQHSGISLGLERMRELLVALRSPQERVPCFHIAGTNGKGSVSAFAASILKSAGLRVGLYTSPHLVDFRERIQILSLKSTDAANCYVAPVLASSSINDTLSRCAPATPCTSSASATFKTGSQINGEMISHEDLDEGIRRLQSATRGWEMLPTFFELTTALAFDYFARQKCDVVVLETGLGGRLDATNLATNKISCAITPISLDHQALLGSTLTEIAGEKAGIMRSGVPVIVSPQRVEAIEVLKKEAAKIKAPLLPIDEPIASEISLGLAGSHQRWNAAVALKLVQQGPWQISDEAIAKGLVSVSWPGRFQCIAALQQSSREDRDPAHQNESSLSKISTTYNLQPVTLVLDGAHNPAAAEQLVATWKEVFGDQKCCLIFGSLTDKEGEKMLRILESIAASIILVPVHSPRTAAPAELKKIFPSAMTFSSLEVIFKKKNIFVDKDVHFSDDRQPPILLTGSLFLVGEALAFLRGRSYFSFSQ